MRWRRAKNTGDVIDARGGGMTPRGGLPGGRMAVPGGLGVVGILVFVLLQALGGGGGGTAFSVDDQFGAQPQAPTTGTGIPASEDPERDLKDFSAYVFTRNLNVWQRIFEADRKPFERAKLVLYRAGVSTGCGDASSAVGPFYCPADKRVYLDLSFYNDMAQKLNATGDFAWAYVIAHEVGHHVQQELGTSDEVRRLQSENPGERNELSVRLELQADCYAGVWAQTVYAAGDLEEGDVDEAIGASEAVGDDRIQSRATGTVDPDSFTHGSSEQRARWFNRGRESGEPGDCDTFAAEEL